MIEISIPGFRDLALAHLVLDYNGTLAFDGRLLPGVAASLADLADRLQVHVITADTFGHAAEELAGVPGQLAIIPVQGQAAAKRRFVEELGADAVVALGNGRNDADMLEAAALGIALIQREGASAQTVLRADAVATGILDALDLLRHPPRLVATLRT